jgi:hypothetical protein
MKRVLSSLTFHDSGRDGTSDFTGDPLDFPRIQNRFFRQQYLIGLPFRLELAEAPDVPAID